MTKDMTNNHDDLRKSPQGKGRGISISNPPKGIFRTLGSRPIIVGVAVASLVLVIFIYSINERQKQLDYGEAARAQKSSGSRSQNMAEELTAGWQDLLLDDENTEVEIPAEEAETTTTESQLTCPALPKVDPPSLMDEEIQRIRLGKLKNYHTALDSGMLISISRPSSDEQASTPQMANYAAGGGGEELTTEQILIMQAQAAQYDPNMQIRKEAFLGENRAPMNYLPYTLKDQISPYEIKTGTIIPGVMVSGINSDLPGQIVGQVSQNIYDTALGRFLLIPQGAKLIGVYDSRIVLGQNRALIAWTRIVFPNGKTLELGTMPGADGLGYAGFSDKVDNHYWRIFGNALLLSLITAGTSYALPDDNKDNNNNDSSINDELRAAIATQMMVVGTNMITKNLNIQPTLEIRPGYRFNIMVNKDIVLYPWTL